MAGVINNRGSGLKLYAQSREQPALYSEFSRSPPKGENVWELQLKQDVKVSTVSRFSINRHGIAGLSSWARDRGITVLEIVELDQTTTQVLLVETDDQVVERIQPYVPPLSMPVALWCNMIDGQQVLSTIKINDDSQEYRPV